ncbi:MAG: glycosyltransferase [Candidatus Saccharimonadales bacterium]
MTEKIIAAVPTYNAGENLLKLGAQLRKENFYKVFILDDCSTDESIEALENEFPEFLVVRGKENKGPAGNRNRILDHISNETIFFIDADMNIESIGIQQEITKALGRASVGMVGGLIHNKSGNPMWWNYGFEMDHDRDARFYDLVSKLDLPSIDETEKAKMLDRLAKNDADYHWISPDHLELKARKVDWVAEGCFAIRGSLFTKINGYDENMRYHEGQDLAKRVRDKGYDVVFDPSVQARHLEIEVRKERRQSDFKEGQFYFFHKHYGMTRTEFNSLYS